MHNSPSNGSLSFRFLLVLGLAWALVEVAFGSVLKAGCPRGMTGSVLTGTAMLFISAAWHTRARAAVLVPLALAVVGKAVGAAALGRPVLGGAVLNPGYAYVMEVVALVAVVGLVGQRRMARLPAAALAGAGAGLAAPLLFLPVGMFTGAKACTHAATGLPLAVVYAPLAVAISAVTVPLGRTLALRVQAWIRADRPYRVRPGVALNLASAVALLALIVAHLVTS